MAKQKSEEHGGTRALVVMNGGAVVEIPVRVLRQVRPNVWEVEAMPPPGINIKGTLELSPGKDAPCLLGEIVPL